MNEPLPVDDVLAELVAAVRARGAAVLEAPAGAGKTTRVPPALLDAGLAGSGSVVVLEPRRVAARAAARRIAAERGVRVGDLVGHHVRFDRRAGPATRVLVVTDGIFLRLLEDDPLLDGVGCVVLDEVHERSLAQDLALALVRRVRESVRPDLNVVAMSATADAAPLAAFLGAGVVTSAGRLHPVEVRHLERPDARPLPEVVASAVRRALAETRGDVLTFLPGVGEIRAVGALLADAARDADVHELYGDLPAERQDAALTAGPRRRVVLATNVAETSVTVEGVTAVVDSGRARVLRHDPATGLDRLELVRIARSSLVQRTGRAGRTAPGVAYRTWTQNEERDFPERLEPEVRRVDVAAAALTLLAWGESDLAAFPWFEPPERERLAAACELLERLGALHDGRVTDVGRAMARLPVHPRLARLLVEGHRRGAPRRTALAAALLSERDAGRAGRRGATRHASASDVLDRMDASARDRGFVAQVARRLEEATEDALGRAPHAAESDDAVLRALHVAYADRLARRRAPGDARAVLAGGGGVRLARESAVLDAELFVCVDVDAGTGPDALVRAASEVRREWLPAERITTRVDVAFDAPTGRVGAVRRTSCDGLVLDETQVPVPADGRAEALLADAAARDLPRALPLADAAVAAFRARVGCLRAWRPELELPALDDDALRALLPELVRGCRSFDDLRRAPLLDHLRGRLTWQQLAALDREAPERIEVPSGSHVRLAYEIGRPPVLAVRIQELFGLRETPRVGAGRVPVLLHLLAPNQRPQQVTDDLPSFWRNTYPVVRAELRRRYPRHAWPEDPLAAAPERRPAPRRG